MVRRAIVIGSAVLVLLAACGRNQSPTPKRGVKRTPTTATPVPEDLRNAHINDVVSLETANFLETAVLGDELGPDRNVAKENDQIPEGHEVHLTMKLRESPVGLQTRAVWKDIFGKDIAMEERAMGGQKVVTFTCKKRLAVGHYSVTGYWGGNIAVERSFDVVSPHKKK